MNAMRMAVIAPAPEIPAYQHAAAQSRGRFEISHVTVETSSPADLDEVFRQSSEYDALIMLDPSSLDLTSLQRFADAQKHILIDASRVSLELLQQIASMWRQAGVTLTVAQRNRFSPYALAIQDSLRDNQLGEAGLVRVHRWLPCGGEEATEHQSIWQATVAEVDLVCWLFQSAPDVLFARSLPRGDNVPGLLLHLGFENGMALLDVSVHKGPGFYTVSVIGSRGAAYADDHHNTNLLLKDQTLGVPVGSDGLGARQWLRPQLEAFVSAIESGEDQESCVAMERAIRLAHLGVQSAAANKVARRVGEDNYELQ